MQASLSINKERETEICPMVESIKAVGGEWKLIIIRYLSDGPSGFNELMRRIGNSNAKTISRTLQSLSSDGIVLRNVRSTQPFRVEYSLSDKGKDLSGVFRELMQWGEKWIEK